MCSSDLVAREGRTPRFSPDGSQIAYWIGKGGRSEQLSRQGGRIFVAPAGGGNFLYMTSDRDGYRCLWGRRIDPATHRPADDLVPVRHFHSSRRSMMNMSVNSLELAVGRDRIAFAQGEVTGNVWLVKLP